MQEATSGSPEDGGQQAQAVSSASTPAKRKHRPGLHRTQIACQRCRLRKNKCDGKLPQCSTCDKAGSPCIVIDRLTYRQYPRGHVEELETQVQQLEQEVCDLKAELRQTRQDRGSVGPSSVHDSGQSQDVVNPSDDSDIVSDIGLLSLEGASERKYVGSSSGVHFGKIMQTVLPRTDYKHDQGPLHSKWNLRIEKSRPGLSPSSETNTEPTALPNEELGTRLVETYFSHRWSSLPFLHKQTFMEKYYFPAMYMQGGATHVSLFFTYMVFAFGAIDLQRQKHQLPSSHLDYFKTATIYYLEGLVERDNMETIQGLLLMTTFAINEPNSLNAWHVAGLAMRMAIDLGMHRNMDEKAGTFHSEMRKRIFWACYCLDRNISIALGRPFSIRDLDINVDMPMSCLTDEDLLLGTPGLSTSSRLLSVLDMTTFSHIIALRRISSQTQDVFYPTNTTGISSEYNEQQRTDIRSKLEDWIKAAPRYHTPTVATFQSMEWFQIAYYHALLLLYRPSPANSIVDAQALQICADSAISLISAYSSLYAKNKITYTWVALHSLFMASVTMLYTLWVGQEIRKHTTKNVVSSNVATCLSLFTNMGELWPAAAERCFHIVERLGKATVALFDNPPALLESTTNAYNILFTPATERVGEISQEYMDWFGTQNNSQTMSSFPQSSSAAHQGHHQHVNTGANLDYDSSIGIDTQMENLTDLDNLFQLGFDMSLPLMTNVFDHNPLLLDHNSQSFVQPQHPQNSSTGSIESSTETRNHAGQLVGLDPIIHSNEYQLR